MHISDSDTPSWGEGKKKERERERKMKEREKKKEKRPQSCISMAILSILHTVDCDICSSTLQTE